MKKSRAVSKSKGQNDEDPEKVKKRKIAERSKKKGDTDIDFFVPLIL